MRWPRAKRVLVREVRTSLIGRAVDGLLGLAAVAAVYLFYSVGSWLTAPQVPAPATDYAALGDIALPPVQPLELPLISAHPPKAAQAAPPKSQPKAPSAPIRETPRQMAAVDGPGYSVGLGNSHHWFTSFGGGDGGGGDGGGSGSKAKSYNHRGPSNPVQEFIDRAEKSRTFH